jgi:hypothetical protein
MQCNPALVGDTEAMANKPQLKKVDEAVQAINTTEPGPVHVEDFGAVGDTEALAKPDADMLAQAKTIESNTDVDSVARIIQSIGEGMNTEKAKLSVALLNVTNYAVGLQGRSAWNARDFMSFGIALAALSQIRREALPSDLAVDMDDLESRL